MISSFHKETDVQLHSVPEIQSYFTVDILSHTQNKIEVLPLQKGFSQTSVLNSSYIFHKWEFRNIFSFRELEIVIYFDISVLQCLEI